MQYELISLSRLRLFPFQHINIGSNIVREMVVDLSWDLQHCLLFIQVTSIPRTHEPNMNYAVFTRQRAQLLCIIAGLPGCSNTC